MIKLTGNGTSTEGITRNENSTKAPVLAVDRVTVRSLYVVSVVQIVVGVACFCLGIPTVVLTASRPALPWSSGSGILAGVVSILTGVFGLVLMRTLGISLSSPHRLKAYHLTFRIFMYSCLDGTHVALSIWAVVVCTRGDGGGTCGGIHRTANTVLAAVNLAVGLVIVTLGTVMFTEFFTLSPKIGKLTKVKDVPRAEDA